MDPELSLTTETVEHLQPSAPLCVEPDVSVREVLALLRTSRVGSAYVCRGGVLIGIFTERDALRLLARGSPLDVRIETVMTAHPVTLQPGDSVATAIRKMSTGGYRRLPIVDRDGRPVGKINVASILHYVVQHFPTAVYNLPPVPQSTTPERDGA